MKVLAWIIGIVVLLIAGAVIFVTLNSGSLIKSVVEELGPDYLGAPVSVGSVDLSLTEGSAGISDLRVGNPAGFDGADAMAVNQIKVSLDTGRLDNPDVIVMKEIAVDGAIVSAIAQGRQTNFQKIMENLEAAAGTSAESQPAADSATQETKFIVEKFAFTNAQASLNSDVLGDMNLSIPDIHLTGIGQKSNGATAAELAQEILKPITQAVSAAAVSQGLDLEGAKQQALDKVKDKIDGKLGGALKGLLDKE